MLADILLHSCPQDYCVRDSAKASHHFICKVLAVSVWRLVRCFEFVSDRLIQEGEWLPKIFDSSLRRGEASADLHITTGVSREVNKDRAAVDIAFRTYTLWLVMRFPQVSAGIPFWIQAADDEIFVMRFFAVSLDVAITKMFLSFWNNIIHKEYAALNVDIPNCLDFNMTL